MPHHDGLGKNDPNQDPTEFFFQASGKTIQLETGWSVNVFEIPEADLQTANNGVMAEKLTARMPLPPHPNP